MSVLEPPEGLPDLPEDVPPLDELPPEEPPAESPAPAQDAAMTPAQYIKQVCGECLRPVLEVNGKWLHWDPRIDQPTNAAHHEASLFVEPPVAWGQMDRKVNFEVKQSPSKVHSGWSGGGVA